MTQSTETTAATIWLSKGAFDKLTAELEYLKGPRRQEILAEISSARDEGDLKENGGYHAAREDQGKNEGQIRLLEEVLLHAQSDVPDDDDVVAVGKVVSYRFQGDDDADAETFLLGARENEDYVDVPVFSPQAPLGAALLGSRRGDIVAFEAPNGKTLQVEVLSAKPYA